MILPRIFSFPRLALAHALSMPSFLPLIRHYLSGGGDWKSAICPVPHLKYGSGYRGWFGRNLTDFRWYLQGESTVDVNTIEDICTWLGECTYVGGMSHAQHPSEFEHSRTGNCADHAIWAWRKLIEVGYDVEFVVGALPETPLSGHAWLVFRDRDRRYLLESVYKDLDRMVMPLSAVCDLYSPYCSIDGNFVRRAYSGRCRLIEADTARSKEPA